MYTSYGPFKAFVLYEVFLGSLWVLLSLAAFHPRSPWSQSVLKGISENPYLSAS